MPTRERRRITVTIKASLRDLSNQISLLNHQVGARVALRDIDLDCFDFISQVGPISPGALARRSGVHPATVTGIVDRLEKNGWIAREQDPSDRRGTLLRALPDRTGELFQLYSGMNAGMDELCAGFDETQLEVIADFLTKAAAAASTATDDLAAS
ncbi:MAG TPA: MarR family transcriptional regulator [Galbitalea sp.]|nr:MarR family transcriptional regulator [Galbitalea sp.]